MSAGLEHLARQLLPDAAEAARFCAAVAGGASGRGVGVWPGPAPQRPELPGWVPEWVGVCGPAGGDCYALDLSSVWAMAVIEWVPRPVRRLLDLCAAPGGKSVVADRWAAPEFHLANEVDARRLGVLRHNLARCRVGAFTQRQRPDWWAARCAGGFDVVLVDAPCSGQSLPARGRRNPGCFRPAVVKGNARRQRRILDRAAAAVAPGGHLIYATCTYSIDENEAVLERFLAGHPDWAPVDVPLPGPWRSPHAAFPCFRLLPHFGLGAGGFVGLLRRGGEAGPLPELPAEVLAWPALGSWRPPAG